MRLLLGISAFGGVGIGMGVFVLIAVLAVLFSQIMPPRGGTGGIRDTDDRGGPPTDDAGLIM